MNALQRIEVRDAVTALVASLVRGWDTRYGTLAAAPPLPQAVPPVALVQFISSAPWANDLEGRMRAYVYQVDLLGKTRDASEVAAGWVEQGIVTDRTPLDPHAGWYEIARWQEVDYAPGPDEQASVVSVPTRFGFVIGPRA